MKISDKRKTKFNKNNSNNKTIAFDNTKDESCLTSMSMISVKRRIKIIEDDEDDFEQPPNLAQILHPYEDETELDVCYVCKKGGVVYTCLYCAKNIHDHCEDNKSSIRNNCQFCK
jgi:hypothetical protein